MGFEAAPIGLERATAPHQHRLQRRQIREGAVGHGLIDQRPQPLGRLQLRRGGGQEDHLDARRQHHRGTGVPAGLIDDQDGPMGGIDALIVGEGGQRQGERLGASPSATDTTNSARCGAG